MIRFFKLIATMEGLSLLFLFFVAMPLKHFAGNKEIVFYTGLTHGILFIAYIVMAVMLKIEKDWDWKKLGIICIASVVPFGTFYIERKYFKAQAV